MNKLPESGPYRVSSYSYETVRAAVDWRDQRIRELEGRLAELYAAARQLSNAVERRASWFVLDRLSSTVSELIKEA